MARPGITKNRKFRRLVRILAMPAAHVLGHLEMMWNCAYEAAAPYMGAPEDVEDAAGWVGKPGQFCSALLSCRDDAVSDSHGFLEEVGERRYAIHDFWMHVPEYVRRRRDREQERNGVSAPKLPYQVARSAAAAELGYSTYDQYLSSTLWKEIRQRVIVAAGGICSKCRTATATQVHHLVYDAETLRGEALENLEAVCVGCHRSAENLRRSPRSRDDNGTTTARQRHGAATDATRQRNGDLTAASRTPTPTPVPTRTTPIEKKPTATTRAREEGDLKRARTEMLERIRAYREETHLKASDATELRSAARKAASFEDLDAVERSLAAKAAGSIDDMAAYLTNYKTGTRAPRGERG